MNPMRRFDELAHRRNRPLKPPRAKAAALPRRRPWHGMNLESCELIAHPVIIVFVGIITWWQANDMEEINRRMERLQDQLQSTPSHADLVHRMENDLDELVQLVAVVEPAVRSLRNSFRVIFSVISRPFSAQFGAKNRHRVQPS